MSSGSEPGPRLRRYLMAVLVMDAALLAAYALVPSWRWRLFAEDRLVETGTAMFLLLAFLVAVGSLWRSRSPLYRAELMAAGGVGLVAFLDEISFGARLFRVRMPALEGGGEFDGAHDLLIVAHRAFAAQGPLLKTLWFVGGLAIAALLLWLGRRRLGRALERLRTELAYQLLAAFFLMLAAAMLLDTLERYELIEETLEFNGGLVLLAAVGAMARCRGRPGRRWREPAASACQADGPRDDRTPST